MKIEKKTNLVFTDELRKNKRKEGMEEKRYLLSLYCSKQRIGSDKWILLSGAVSHFAVFHRIAKGMKEIALH